MRISLSTPTDSSIQQQPSTTAAAPSAPKGISAIAGADDTLTTSHLTDTSRAPRRKEPAAAESTSPAAWSDPSVQADLLRGDTRSAKLAIEMMRTSGQITAAQCEALLLSSEAIAKASVRPAANTDEAPQTKSQTKTQTIYNGDFQYELKESKHTVHFPSGSSVSFSGLTDEEFEKVKTDELAKHAAWNTAEFVVARNAGDLDAMYAQLQTMRDSGQLTADQRKDLRALYRGLDTLRASNKLDHKQYLAMNTALDSALSSIAMRAAAFSGGGVRFDEDALAVISAERAVHATFGPTDTDTQADAWQRRFGTLAKASVDDRDAVAIDGAGVQALMDEMAVRYPTDVSEDVKKAMRTGLDRAYATAQITAQITAEDRTRIALAFALA